MIIRVFDDKQSLGEAAAEQAAIAMHNAISQAGKARVIAASAASQFQFLNALTRKPEIDWKRVELFHLDEYISLPMTHPASFCRFLQEHLISKTGITNYHFLNGE
jgi:glucosamine-6-phosphate deaminase